MAESTDNAFVERLRASVKNSGYSRQKDFAIAAGISPTVLSEYLNGRSEPTRPKLIAIANTAGVSFDWLATGATSAPGFSSADSFNATVNQEWRVATPAAIYPDSPTQVKAGGNKAAKVFQGEWLAQKFGAAAHHLHVLDVEGDSMNPTLENGDLVVWDSGFKSKDSLGYMNTPASQLSPGLYAVIVGGINNGSILVRRIEPLPNNAINISCDNRNYKPFLMTGPEFQKAVIVLGKIIWRGSAM
jgi:phage repressor protein C with HTH and peptisase S24 domain